MLSNSQITTLFPTPGLKMCSVSGEGMKKYIKHVSHIQKFHIYVHNTLFIQFKGSVNKTFINMCM